MAEMVRARKISSVELVKLHLDRIEQANPKINAVVHSLADSALRDAASADARLARGEACGPLHGVPFSVKDSIDVAGTRCTAGTLGRREAEYANEDATLVHRLRAAGGIPIAKTNLPDLLFSFESDNYIFGRTNNPYDLTRTSGGSSGGESALIASGGSPLGLGSDCAGSVRLPAAFCGLASIKPTSGRLPRTGHVPPAGSWIEKLWQIGPMARWTEDVVLAMKLLSGPDGFDLASPPVSLIEAPQPRELRVAFFTDNGITRCTPEVIKAIENCARPLADFGMRVEARTPPYIEQCYELEMAILGADGMDGIDDYLSKIGGAKVHPLLTDFTNRMRPFRATASAFAQRWAQWDEYRSQLMRFFDLYDAVLSPVYTQPALKHGDSTNDENFEGFSYTMAWNVAGFPAATVRCGEVNGLPINVQVIAAPWREMTALSVCRVIEERLGGWQAPPEAFSHR